MFVNGMNKVKLFLNSDVCSLDRSIISFIMVCCEMYGIIKGSKHSNERYTINLLLICA